MTFRTFLAVAFCGLLAAAPALPAYADHSHGAAAATGEIAVSHAVARATIGAAPNSAAYMTISTTGAADRLVGAASPVARSVELHESRQVDGVMQMGRVEGIDIAPGADAVLAPGGLHVMLIGLEGPLEDGTTIPLTLTFESGAEITLEVPVSKDVGGHGH